MLISLDSLGLSVEWSRTMARRHGPWTGCVVGLMATPGRRKPGRPRGGEPARETVVALKGAAAWKAWLDEFAAHCRLGLADTIEQALLAYARERGFRDPPKR